MKSLILFLYVGACLADYPAREAPYPAAGWRPLGVQFNLPINTQEDVAREYGSPVAAQTEYSPVQTTFVSEAFNQRQSKESFEVEITKQNLVYAGQLGDSPVIPLIRSEYNQATTDFPEEERFLKLQALPNLEPLDFIPTAEDTTTEVYKPVEITHHPLFPQTTIQPFLEEPTTEFVAEATTLQPVDEIPVQVLEISAKLQELPTESGSGEQEEEQKEDLVEQPKEQVELVDVEKPDADLAATEQTELFEQLNEIGTETDQKKFEEESKQEVSKEVEEQTESVPTESSSAEFSTTESSSAEFSATESSSVEFSATEATATEFSATEVSPTDALPTESLPEDAAPTDEIPTETKESSEVRELDPEFGKLVTGPESTETSAELEDSDDTIALPSTFSGQYYILTPEKTLQRVMFMTLQTEEDKKTNGFTAQLKYQPVEPIKDPIYAYNEQGQLVRIYKKK